MTAEMVLLLVVQVVGQLLNLGLIKVMATPGDSSIFAWTFSLS